MRATHRDGRTFEGDEAEFYRTYAPAGFNRVEEPAPDVDADEADTADDQPKKATKKKATTDGDA